MNVTHRLLRRLVTEAMDAQANKKAYETMGHAVRAAKRFVEAIVEGSRDGEAIDDLRARSKELTAYARFLEQRGAPQAKVVGKVAKHVEAVASRSGLWATLAQSRKLEYKDFLQKELYGARKGFTDFADNIRVDRTLKTVGNDGQERAAG